MLAAAFHQKTFSQDMKGHMILMTDYSLMACQVQALSQMASQVRKRMREVRETADRLPCFVKNNWILCRSLKGEAQRLEREAESLEELSGLLEEIVKLYMERDVKVSQLW